MFYSIKIYKKSILYYFCNKIDRFLEMAGISNINHETKRNRHPHLAFPKRY